MRRIGVLMGYDENDPFAKLQLSALTQALADLGWIDGRNMGMDVRWGGGDINRIREVARELVGLHPDIIVASSTPVAATLQRETRTIPIVFVNVSDPVVSGIVAALNQSGGNITGFALYETPLGGKWLELLSKIAPGLKRAAIMFNPDTAPVSVYIPSFEAAARSLNVVPIVAPVHDDVEIETAIIGVGREPLSGLVVMPDTFTAISSAQPAASLRTAKLCCPGSTMTSKLSFATSIPQNESIAIHLRTPSLLMRARAQATVRVWKKRSELQAHSRFTIQGGCGLPVAAGAVS